jgi:hypothetical protein
LRSEQYPCIRNCGKVLRIYHLKEYHLINLYATSDSLLIDSSD